MRTQLSRTPLTPYAPLFFLVQNHLEHLIEGVDKNGENRNFIPKISTDKTWPTVFFVHVESYADVEYLVISSLSCSEEKGSIPFFGLCPSLKRH